MIGESVYMCAHSVEKCSYMCLTVVQALGWLAWWVQRAAGLGTTHPHVPGTGWNRPPNDATRISAARCATYVWHQVRSPAVSIAVAHTNHTSKLQANSKQAN
jgi:hypothetical protein